MSPRAETFAEQAFDTEGEDLDEDDEPELVSQTHPPVSVDDYEGPPPGSCEERCRLVSLCIILTLLAATIIAGVTAPWWLPYPPECTLPEGGVQVRARLEPAPPKLREPIAVQSAFLFDYGDKWEREWLGSLGLTPDLRTDRLAAPELWPAEVVLVAPRSVAGTAFERTLRAFKTALATGAVQRFGLVHLGDEEGLNRTTPSSIAALYNASQCMWVLRNYYYPGAPPNVFFLPLGTKSGFPSAVAASSRTASATRDLIWAFAGSHKSDRMEAIRQLLPLRPNKAHWIAEWQLVYRLSNEDYAALLQRAVFAPAPAGDHNLDSFRVYEALEAGVLPIAIKSTDTQPAGGDYFTNLLGPGHPVLGVSSWYEAGHTICGLLKDPPRLRRTLADASKWWAEYKESLRDRVDSLRAALLPGGVLPPPSPAPASGWLPGWI